MNLKEAKKVLEVLTTGIEPQGRSTYISPSYLKRVKNKFLGLPEFGGNQEAFDFGEELHRRVLEPDSKQRIILPEARSILADQMTKVAHKEFGGYLEGARFEVKFQEGIVGGKIDILGDKYVADLKTTSARTKNAFIKSLKMYDNFRQAVFYMIITQRENFYFLGIEKRPEARTFIVNCADHQDLIEDAWDEMKFLFKIAKIQSDENEIIN